MLISSSGRKNGRHALMYFSMKKMTLKAIFYIANANQRLGADNIGLVETSNVLCLTISLALFLSITNTTLAQQPPSGGGGGGGITTLSNLGCGPREIARVNDAEEWDCSRDLATLEDQNLDFRVTRAQSIADRALFLADDALARVFALEPRVSTLEQQDLDNRITVLENSAVEFARRIVVSPVGATPADNGASLLAAARELETAVPAPSADNPYQIFLEPGVYQLDNSLLLPSFVSLAGAGPTVTTIRGGLLADGQFLVDVQRNPDGFGFFEIQDLTIAYQANSLSSGGSRIPDFMRGRIQNVTIRGNGDGIAISAGGALTVDMSETILANSGRPFHSTGSGNWRVSDLRAIGNSGQWFFHSGNLDLRDSQIDVLLISPRSGSFAISNSVLASIFDRSGVISIATSQIRGSVSGSPLCVFSYDADLIPLDSSCQPSM